jgi:RNA polymerase sigma factor (sigma-70 family)
LTTDRSRVFLTIVNRHLAPLYRYVRRQLQHHREAARLEPTQLMAEEVVNEVFLTAMRRYEKAPGEGSPSLRSLRQIARSVIGREVARVSERARLEVSLETPVGSSQAVAGFSAEEEVRLIDILPDPAAPVPLDEVVHAEFERYLQRSLEELPPAWVEALLLHAVDGLSPGQVAVLAGEPEEVVQRTLRQARSFLRAKLLEQYSEMIKAS